MPNSANMLVGKTGSSLQWCTSYILSCALPGVGLCVYTKLPCMPFRAPSHEVCCQPDHKPPSSKCMYSCNGECANSKYLALKIQILHVKRQSNEVPNAGFSCSCLLELLTANFLLPHVSHTCSNSCEKEFKPTSHRTGQCLDAAQATLHKIWYVP